MKKINVLKIIGIVAIAGLSLLAAPSFAKGWAPGSANGKYTNLIQEVNCPSDAAKYGNFKDYGYWAGGKWCGQMGQAGYWVWLNPRWYVWATKKETRR